MIHLRVVSPLDLTEKVVGLLAGDPGVLNLVVLPGRARNPDGDAIECDVLSGTANTVLPSLRRLQVDRRGSIVIEPVELAISGRRPTPATQRARCARQRPGLGGGRGPHPRRRDLLAELLPLSDHRRAHRCGRHHSPTPRSSSSRRWSWRPEYGAITSIALGLDQHSGQAVREGLSALTVGFLLAIVAAFAFALLVRVLGLEPTAFRLGIRPVTNLIDTPNFYSLVVAVLAGIVGIVSLTDARTSTLLGVFISVTTIPAASDIGVASAFGSWSEARGSLLQLLLNIVVLIVVGVLTLRFVRLLWRRISNRRNRDA